MPTTNGIAQNGSVLKELNGYNTHGLDLADEILRDDAFALTSEKKIALISEHFEQIMDILGLDLENESLKGTPRRVAKMYVNEIFSGLDPKNKPKVTLFPNTYKFRQMLVEKDIELTSTCEHHFLPIKGVAHVAYFPKSHVVGLSKLNRIVEYYARRPQVQERLTIQIADALEHLLKTEDVAIYIKAHHNCVSCRGVRHQNSETVTTEYRGQFLNRNVRAEFMEYLR